MASLVDVGTGLDGSCRDAAGGGGPKEMRLRAAGGDAGGFGLYSGSTGDCRDGLETGADTGWAATGDLLI